MADSDQDPALPDALRRTMSSMMDGDRANSGSLSPTKPWKEHEVARQAWHEYHVIGDVLRNDELACGARGDERFLLALRAKLAEEPRVLAPAPLLQTPSNAVWWRWAAPAAVAAGFMAVASVLVVSRLSTPAADGTGMALAPKSATPVDLPSSATTALAANTPGLTLRRDPALDAYLRAHRESTLVSPSSWSGGSARATNAALVQNK